VFHPVNHAARTEEQQRLEESVRQQMQRRGDIRADSKRGKHVAELRYCRVGQHLLDIVLRQGNTCGKQRRECPMNAINWSAGPCGQPASAGKPG